MRPVAAVLCIASIVPALCWSESPAPDPWAPVRSFVGRWEGEGSGQAGDGKHWSFLSYDRARKMLVLRQFHVEGFVNQYAMSPDRLKGFPSR